MASKQDVDRLSASQPLESLLSRGPAVQRFVQELVSLRQFHVSTLKRTLSRIIFTTASGQPATPHKPHGLSVTELVSAHPALFGHGPAALPPSAHTLSVAWMCHFHSLACPLCEPVTVPLPSGIISHRCYFSLLLPCITHGWLPAFTAPSFCPAYATRGNYPSTAAFSSAVELEIASARELGVLRPCTPVPGQQVCPMGAILRNSDRAKAMALCGIAVKDQPSLDRANAALLRQQLGKIKVRITHDLTAPGINAATLTPGFSYPGLKDGLRLVYRDCYMGVADISRYFNSFPWATPMYPLMRFQWAGVLYEFIRLCFGFSACPYYCSTWSAEIRQWVLAFGLSCAHMMDDWFFVGPSDAAVRDACGILAVMLLLCGFSMAVEKNVYGQCVKYLGFLIDSRSMTLRVDRIQALGTLLALQNFRQALVRGGGIDLGLVRHLAGKLNWYSELVQSGRLHTGSFWHASQGASQAAASRPLLMAHCDWWINLLQRWAEGSDSHLQYRILSASELLADPQSILIVQSDASGEDGLGYQWGFFRDTNPRYSSQQWPPEGPPGSSFVMELTALLHFLEVYGGTHRNIVLLWVTDSTSAALAVNKSYCRDPAGRATLLSILQLCDDYHYELVALWVPREANQLSDYLSHLSAMHRREFASGWVSELAAAL